MLFKFDDGIVTCKARLWLALRSVSAKNLNTFPRFFSEARIERDSIEIAKTEKSRYDRKGAFTCALVWIRANLRIFLEKDDNWEL